LPHDVFSGSFGFCGGQLAARAAGPGRPARQTPTALSAQLLASLNDVFDLALRERQAFASRVPAHIVRLLLWTSIVAIAGLGYHLGTLGARQLVLSTLLILMWVGQLALLVDINRTGQGFVSVATDPLVWTVERFEQPPDDRAQLPVRWNSAWISRVTWSPTAGTYAPSPKVERISVPVAAKPRV